MKGHFRKRGSKWSFSVDIGPDPTTGKRKQKTVSGFKTKKEAEKACAELITQIENGLYVNESKITFGEFILDWLDTVAKPTLRATTLAGYTSAIKSRLIPTFGIYKLVDIKPVQVMRYYSKLLSENVSEEYVNYLHSILTNSFNTAVKWGVIKNNILSQVDAPSRKRKQMKVWTLEEANLFLRAVKKDKPHYYMLYLLAIYTGMRRGEILALKWKDCLLDQGKISVNKSLSYISGQGIISQETKTGRSNRVISIPQSIINELKNHKNLQQEDKKLFGEGYQDNDYIIAKKDGTPLNPQYVHNHFKKFIKSLEIPDIRFHDLRHTHASIMLKIGEHPKIVSERLGHSSIQMTLNVYSHVTFDMQQESAARFDQAMSNARKL
ncbi:site-specific integrase [Brevibacillus laterosporus]|uniref:site-specific integrase n=1 Tax=Brevibacillus laterosporus TaxID=1465 RepID=UPI002E236B6E|nr:site-specific integrase [Brevibacillus laterosporus]MED1670339.1 site-specific integrase [Brevibacillus laterosporus]MED1717865.1 site-specific integrase [Brevibacillus laterosporus]